jgi:hypothetical protein
MLNYQGNFLIKLTFGQDNISIDPSNLKELVITQDINKYLPTFSMKIIDAQGLFTHLAPSDKLLSRIHFQIGRDLKIKDENYNSFDFTVYRRNPEGDFTSSAVYDIRGMLTTDNLFAPSFCRGFSGSVSSTMQQIGSELSCSDFEISDNLNYIRPLFQANWSNSTFIDWLKTYLQGKDSESAYQIFVKCYRGRNIFVCKTLKDLFKQSVKSKFIINNEPVQDYYPALEFSIFDNYKVFGVFGSKNQKYHYFDYFNSAFVSSEIEATDMMSLAEYFLIDQDDVTDSNTIDNLGRNTESSEDYQYFVKGKYFNRLNSLAKMWILTWGLPNVAPGDIVQVLFAQGKDSGNLQSYQHSGYWMVERVVHSFTGTHRTRLLLTRSGVDTDRGTTLLRATDVRK